MTRLYATEWCSTKYNVSFEVDASNFERIYKDCKERGVSFDEFIDEAKEYLDDNKWDYQYDREYYDEESNDFEWDEGWEEFEEELRDYFEDYDEERDTVIGELGNE